MTGCSTAARSKEQRPSSTSVKSIRARSVMPREMSRLRRPISMSIHSTCLPSAARQEATPPVSEVFPVPPLPDVTTITVPIECLLPDGYYYTICNQIVQIILCEM